MQKMSPSKKREALSFYLLISPWLLVFFALGLLPLLWGLYLACTNYTGFNFNQLHWVGLSNFSTVFHDDDAISSLFRTIILSIVIVPLSTAIGFLLAVLLNNKIKGLPFFRTVFYLPSVFPVIAAGLMWQVMYGRQDGVINIILGYLGIHPINWMGYNLAQTSLVLMMLWGSGGALMIYLAGLKNVPQSLYESAAIDGAGSFQKFWKITIPLTTPVIFYNVIMGIIGSLQMFAQPMLLTPGASWNTVPLQPIYLYVVNAWIQIFTNNRYSYGLALLWVLFIVVFILSLIVFFTSRYWVYYESGEE
ncbi:multiple sugar transport system permease protein [Pullulanibacillus pueri]|uniref:Spermidine/putrescine ABC transporter permease n=1 Tax=Pullulanibacillus pueri TaxID=1437324 RepID=A0A8J2ZUM7_9BACL|nr:sugar ABC transporter permease [Pullulanibacillus pueri]MBM7681392.1 multiple sugar transport system permease protein [Pullulanibacillus pueri]GGH78698.1 spermidine/putrescine ABC transporter permease [Pullulanibacillus pueri]